MTRSLTQHRQPDIPQLHWHIAYYKNNALHLWRNGPQLSTPSKKSANDRWQQKQITTDSVRNSNIPQVSRHASDIPEAPCIRCTATMVGTSCSQCRTLPLWLPPLWLRPTAFHITHAVLVDDNNNRGINDL